MLRTRRIFYGWWVLIALFVVGIFGPMARFSITAFFPAISSELGWSRSVIGGAQSLTLWAYSFLSILTGWMIDKIGSRRTIFIGGIMCLIGWILLSRVQSLWQLYLYYGLIMAIAVSNTHLVPLLATSRKWFAKRAGLASGIVSSGFALGTAFIVPLLTWLSSIYSWHDVSLVAGFAFGIPIMLLAYFVIRNTPESIGQHPDGENLSLNENPNNVEPINNWNVKSALKTQQFWLLFVAYGLIGVTLNGLIAHLVIWAVDLKSTYATAGFFVTLYNGTSIIARLGSGWLGDKYGKKTIMALGGLFSTIILLIGWQVIYSTNHLLIYIPILGIGAGLSSILFAPWLGDLFGRKNVGSLFGLLTLSWGLIGGLGPVIWGIIVDISGSYNVALLMSGICYAFSVVMLLLVRPITLQNTRK